MTLAQRWTDILKKWKMQLGIRRWANVTPIDKTTMGLLHTLGRRLATGRILSVPRALASI